MRLVNIYPPYVGAGIRVLPGRGDSHTIRVAMPLRPYNRNLFGTHFGGSLYAMCDPFFAFLLVRHLGGEYLCWDKAASIEFLRPGKGRVTATFHVPPERVEEIRTAADRGETVEPVFVVEVLAADGTAVARVTKRLWVRKKRPRPAGTA